DRAGRGNGDPAARIGGIKACVGRTLLSHPEWRELGLAFRDFRTYSFIHKERSPVRMLINWVLSAVALIIVAHLISGFHVSGIAAALIAALVIGFVNATLGFFLKIVTFPFIILTLGLFWLIINAVMIELASSFVPGFHVDTFGAAFW